MVKLRVLSTAGAWLKRSLFQMIDNTPIPQFRWFTRNPYIHILSIRGTNDMEESRIIPIRPFPDRDRSPLSARPDMELNIRKIIYLRSKIT